MGAFISLMSSSFAYEDPLIRQQQQAIGAISTTGKAKEIFAEMGRGMWKSGKGFAKVTVLFAGTECVIESVSFFSLFPFPQRTPLGSDPIPFHPRSLPCESFRQPVPLSDGSSYVRSIGLGMISGMPSRLDLSLEVC